jgi:hypothetical protein
LHKAKSTKPSTTLSTAPFVICALCFVLCVNNPLTQNSSGSTLSVICTPASLSRAATVASIGEMKSPSILEPAVAGLPFCIIILSKDAL